MQYELSDVCLIKASKYLNQLQVLLKGPVTL